MPIATRRTSKYIDAVRDVLRRTGHATNTEIATVLRKDYPHISDTTVHRITSRLVHDGEWTYGPVLQSGVMRFDINLLPHDHFQCSACNSLRDFTLPISVRNHIEEAIGGCTINGQLTITGNCHNCKQ